MAAMLPLSKLICTLASIIIMLNMINRPSSDASRLYLGKFRVRVTSRVRLEASTETVTSRNDAIIISTDRQQAAASSVHGISPTNERRSTKSLLRMSVRERLVCGIVV